MENRILTAMDVYLFARNIKNRVENLEYIILNSQDHYTKINYAKHVIKGRWPEAEEIFKQPENILYAYDYTIKVIKDRWFEIENQILKTSNVCIIDYTLEIIQGRWVEGEKILLENFTKQEDVGFELLDYCEFIINGRWNEFEIILIKHLEKNRDATLASLYSFDIMKKRWREIEKYILEDEDWADEYLKFFTTINHHDWKKGF